MATNFDPAQLREDAQWGRIESLSAGAVRDIASAVDAAQEKRYAEKRERLHRLASSADELARLREGLEKLRDEWARPCKTGTSHDRARKLTALLDAGSCREVSDANR